MKIFFPIVILCLVSLQTFGDEQKQTKPDCRSLVSQVKTSTSADWEFQHRSYQSTAGVSLAFVPLVHGARVAISGGPYFTPTFDVTFLTDPALTLMSHAVNLSPRLKKIFSGKYLGKRFEAIGRIGASMVLGTAAVIGSWVMRYALAGQSPAHAVTPVSKCFLAAGLCTVVYPTLYLLKTKIFKQIPMRGDIDRFEAAKKNPLLSDALVSVQETAEGRAGEIGIPENEILELQITLLENKILEHAYEDSLPPELLDDPELISLVEKTREADSKWRKEGLRYRIISKLIEIYETSPQKKEIAGEALFLGLPFTIEGSVELHKLLAQRFATQHKRVWLGSLLDQTISVGIFGGVLLYHVNSVALSY